MKRNVFRDSLWMITKFHLFRLAEEFDYLRNLEENLKMQKVLDLVGEFIEKMEVILYE